AATGGEITLNGAGGETGIAVDADPAASQIYTATINTKLTGGSSLLKTGLGTLVLAGDNSYTGGTVIDDGVLQISADKNLGADAAGGLTTGLTFKGGPNLPAVLHNTQAIAMARPVHLDGTGGTFQTDGDLTLNGVVDGGGALTKLGAATLVLKGANSYGGGTFINEGTVSVEADNNLGAPNSRITFNGGTLANTAAFRTSARPITVNAATGTLPGGGAFRTDLDLTLAGAIENPSSGPANLTGGPLTKKGAGKLILAADGNYSGTFTIDEGELVFGDASTGGTGAAGSVAGPIVDNAALSFDRSNAFTYGNVISGSGTLTQKGPGETTLTGANSYKGATTVAAGTLIIDGDQTGATGATTVASGATLRGKGTIGGDVTIDAGGNLTAQDQNGDTGYSALSINGKLALDPGASLNYNYGADPATNNKDALLIRVKGDLDLNGTLNVSNTSGDPFLIGVYGLIKYGGALSGSGLTLGAMPGPDFLLQTGSGRVDLVYTAGQDLDYWSVGAATGGLPNGGTGVWQGPGGAENWTDQHATLKDSYADNGNPIFAGTAGTVTVDARSFGPINVTGMQFVTSGYLVTGDAINLDTGANGIRVGDMSTDAFNTIATIESELAGAGQLVKQDHGTLVLKGANSYTGGTLIDAGTLQISSDGNLGAAGTQLALAGGILQNTAQMSSARQVSLGNGGGTFQTDQNLTLTGGITGAGSLAKTGNADLILSGPSSYTGATNVNTGTLAAGAERAFSAASAVNVAKGARLALRGYSQETGALTNSGTVDLGGAEPGAILAVKGDYTGKDGSVVALSTRLEGDDSKTDRLVVEGSSSGNTLLSVRNAGGGGAQTDQGIKLVEVRGASDARFTLEADYNYEGSPAIAAGAYAYRLFQGGPDWYLRSQLMESDQPQFQAGVPVYEAYTGVLQAFNQLDSLQNRLGNRNWTIEAQGADGLSEEVAPEQGTGRQSVGVWGNIEASDHRYRPESSTSQTDYDAAVWKLETGVDGMLYENEAGRLIGGASLQYGTIAARIASPHGDGKIDATGVGIGGTLTWYGNDGLYADGQARVTWYDSDLSSDIVDRSLASGNDGRGYGLSIEAGKRFPILPNWFLTPQAQLAWSRISIDGFSDGFDADVTVGKGDSLMARMGLAANHERQWEDVSGQTRRLHAYGVANLYYDFDSKYTVDVASTPFTTKTPPLWAGIALGGSYNWANDRYSLYG
ncbi:autotransporter outer membrane beta-barrel domain-containing protein, partial [Brucella endophytica]